MADLALPIVIGILVEVDGRDVYRLHVSFQRRALTPELVERAYIAAAGQVAAAFGISAGAAAGQLHRRRDHYTAPEVPCSTLSRADDVMRWDVEVPRG